MPLLPLSYYRDKILTELGLPLNFFSPVGATEFTGDFPEDLNETFKAVTYSSDEFNIEWFFESGKTNANVLCKFESTGIIFSDSSEKRTVQLKEIYTIFNGRCVVWSVQKASSWARVRKPLRSRPRICS